MSKSLRVSCSRDNLKVIRNFVAEALEQYALSDIIQNQIILAVDEVCANFIIHANKEDFTKYLCVKVEHLDSEFVIEISDEGTFYDAKAYQEPQLTDLIKEGRKGGVGMMLVNRIMDEVEYLSDGKTNRCRLHKKVAAT